MGFGWLANYNVFRLRRGEPVTAWADGVDVRADPSLASDVADALPTLASVDQRGLSHCSGREGLTEYRRQLSLVSV